MNKNILYTFKSLHIFTGKKHKNKKNAVSFRNDKDNDC